MFEAKRKRTYPPKIDARHESHSFIIWIPFALLEALPTICCHPTTYLVSLTLLHACTRSLDASYITYPPTDSLWHTLLPVYDHHTHVATFLAVFLIFESSNLSQSQSIPLRVSHRDLSTNCKLGVDVTLIMPVANCTLAKRQSP